MAPKYEILAVGPSMPEPTPAPIPVAAAPKYEVLAVGPTPEIRRSMTTDELLGADAVGSPYTQAARLAIGGFSRMIPAVGDEIVAGGSSLLDALMGEPLSSAYDRRLNEIRNYQRAFAQEGPKSSAAVDIGSALLMPLGTTVKSTDTILGTAAKIAAEGGALGTAYGFGEGEGGIAERAKLAAMLGGVGAAAGPLIGMPAGWLLGKAVTGAANKAAEYQIPERLSALKDRLLREEGAVLGGKAGKAGPLSYTPGELMVARELRTVPIENIEAAAKEMSEAAASDVPLFLPEAVKSAKIDRNAKFIANYDPSMDFAQRAIEQRTAGAEARAAKAFSKISPEASTFEGATAMKNAAANIIKEAEEARGQLVAPVYRRAYEEMPVINNPGLTELLEKDKILARLVAKTKETAANADFPNNATELLVKVRDRLWDKAEDAVARGAKSEARDLKRTYAQLNEIMHGASKTLKQADALYSGISRRIDNTDSTLIGYLRKLTDDRVSSVDRIFKLSPERIKDLRSKFQAAGKIKEWNAGIRSTLQDVAQSSRTGRNFAEELIGSTEAKAQLKAALGSSYDDVVKALEVESRMFKGKNKYAQGSPTQGYFAEEKSLIEGADIINAGAGGNWREFFTRLFNSEMPDETAQEMARIYFTTGGGTKAIERIRPLLQQYQANRILGQQASTAATRGATAAGATQGRSPLQSSGSRVSRSARKPYQTTPKSAETLKAPNDASLALDGTPILQKQIQAPKNQGSLSESSTQVSPKKTDVSYNMSADSAGLQQVKFTKESIKKTAEKKLPPLLQAMIEVESGYNHKAVSKRGAKGLMQLMPSNIAAFGVKDPFDPTENINAGIKLLNEEIGRFKDLKLAVAAYNAGSPAVRAAIKAAKSRSWAKVREKLPLETRSYVDKIYKLEAAIIARKMRGENLLLG